VRAELDRRVGQVRGRIKIEADASVETAVDGSAAHVQLQALAEEIDLDPIALRDTLEAAMAVRGGRPQLEYSDSTKTCRLVNPGLPGWSDVVDESLRRRLKGGALGPVSRLAFGAEPFLEDVGGRLVFSPRPDVLLAHLAHPMLQHAISTLTRRRFPGTAEEVSRWTVRLAPLPAETEALLLLSVEELAVNDLRETFHHWVRTLVFPVAASKLGRLLPHQTAFALRGGVPSLDVSHRERARDVVEDVEPELKAVLSRHAEHLTQELRRQLHVSGTDARRHEEERYRSRQGEVSTLIAENTLTKLEREIERLKSQREQGFLFEEEERLSEIDRSIGEKRAEIDRRTRHYEEVRAQLDHERERILRHLLPKRHSMSGAAQVFPVSIEVRLPGGSQ
jgi:hypothetical protein